MSVIIWTAILTILCCHALAAYFPSHRPNSIFDELPHKPSEIGGKPREHIGYHKAPQFGNNFRPSWLRVPQFPTNYYRPKENNAYNPFPPAPLSTASSRGREYGSFSPPISPSPRIVHPKYEVHPGIENERGGLSQDTTEHLKDLEQLKSILDEFHKHFSKNGIPHKPFSSNISPPSWRIGTKDGDRKPYESQSKEFPSEPYPKQNRFVDRPKSSISRTPLDDILRNLLEPKFPVHRPAFEHELPQQTLENVKDIPPNVRPIHRSSQARDELQRIKDFLNPPVHKAPFSDKRRIRNDEKSATPIELDFSESNKTVVRRELLRTLLIELPTHPDSQKIYKLKLLVNPPENKNTSFVREFMNILKNITTKFIPEAVTGAKLTAFKKNNNTLLVFQVNLYIKYLNKSNFKELPKRNHSFHISSEKVLNNKNEAVLELEKNENNTVKVAKINLDKINFNYKESLKSILYQLLENSTLLNGSNKFIGFISIKLPSHGSIELTDSLFRTAQSVMCKIAPDLITLDNLNLPQRMNRTSPRIEILIPIQNSNTSRHLAHFDLTHKNINLYAEIFIRVSRTLNLVTRCQPENSTVNLNLTMLLPKYESGETIKDISRLVTDIARKVEPHHRIYVRTETKTLNNSLKLDLNITMKPSGILEYDEGNKKEISIDLRRPGSSIVPKIRELLPGIVKEIEESTKPISLIFNVSFPLGIDKDFLTSEISTLISLLEEAIPIEYGSIANVILHITVIPTEMLREKEIMRDIKIHKYRESLMKTTESPTSTEYSNGTDNNSSVSPSYNEMPETTNNQNPFLPRISYPRSYSISKTAPSVNELPFINKKFNSLNLAPPSYNSRTSWPTSKKEKVPSELSRPFNRNLQNNYDSFRRLPYNLQKYEWRRPTNFKKKPLRWHQTTSTSNNLKTASTTSSSNSVESWTPSERNPFTSGAYQTPKFHFPAWLRMTSASPKTPRPFFSHSTSTYHNYERPIARLEEYPTKQSISSHTYENYAKPILSPEEYSTNQSREPWNWYNRHIQNQYNQFRTLPHHLKKTLLRHMLTPQEENKFVPNWENKKNRTLKPTTKKIATSTTSPSNSTENWTESENSNSTSAVYIPKIAEHSNQSSQNRSSEKPRRALQRFYRYLKHKYHKFQKLPHHLKKHIWKHIPSSWKKPIVAKNVKKYLAKLGWPSLIIGTSKPTTFESTTFSSTTVENSNELEEISSSRSVHLGGSNINSRRFVPYQHISPKALHNRKYDQNKNRKHPKYYHNLKYSKTTSQFETLNTSSSTSNTLTSTPTSENTESSSATTSSLPSTSTTETTFPTSIETTSISTFLPSVSETETTGMTTTESSSTNIQIDLLSSQSEYSTAFPTSSEATMSTSQEQITPSTPYYPNFSSRHLKEYTKLMNFTKDSFKQFGVPQPNHPASLENEINRNEAEKTINNITTESATPKRSSFIGAVNFRKPRLGSAKIKSTNPRIWLPHQNQLTNNYPSKNSVEERLSSKGTNEGEVIDKESSLQYYENTHFNVKKRSLNFSKSNSNMLSNIEENVMSVLQKNANAPTVILYKITPSEGMMVSELKTLTEPLLSYLISELPTSEINIITRAYYNDNQEIQLMKMKITINYSNDEMVKYIQNDSTSSLLNVLTVPNKTSEEEVWTPLIDLDNLSLQRLKHKIATFALKYLFRNNTSNQNISAIINFAFETNEVTSSDIAELENSISEVLDKMHISRKFLSKSARLELKNEDDIVIIMPFSVNASKDSLKMYIKSLRNRKIKNELPVERISDLILAD